MSSSKADEKTENSSAMQKNSAINDKLANLSCPFTWGMENVIENHNKLLDANENRLETVADIQDYFPEFILIYHLMLAYENCMKNDLSSAMQSLDSAEQSLADIKKTATLKNVKNVLQHIFVATKCYVFQKLERIPEAVELLDEICDVDDMNKVESAMLNGCQCLAWSLYYATDNMKAIKHAEKAVEYEPGNGKWYFLLGKNYRRLRRRHTSIGLQPSPPEATAFEKAFKLHKNVLFGVSLAQMYRESMNYPMANKIYKQVYDLQPTCCKVRLQLALGFIRAKQCMEAKSCLDYVAENMPDSRAYNHYMGIYQEKCNRDFEAALPYYESATKGCNAVAEWQYIECRKKVEQDWDPLPYMLSLLERYEKESDHIIQGINIQIGAYYLFEKHDILSACPYLTKAIEISPAARLLKEHRLLFHQFDSVNIYHALTKEIQFALKNAAAEYDDDKTAVLKEALQLCRKNCKGLPSPSASSREENPSSLSSNYRNYGRGRSSRAGIRVTRDSPGLSSRGFPKNHPQQHSGDARNSPKERIRGDEKDSASSHRGRSRGGRQAASAKPRDDKKDDGEADASCCLVKTLKNLNL